MYKSWIFRCSMLAVVLTLLVIVLGAYVRLSHAGLGCPDWPGCYGHITIPNTEYEIANANAAYPERPVEAPKAWKEMVHRYFASALGLLIIVIVIVSWLHYRNWSQMKLPLLLLLLVLFQGALGMWTVTLLLKPLVVTAHLIGGMTILALLSYLALRHSPIVLGRVDDKPLRVLAIVGLIAVVLQIALGGWTSSNYAALACYGFPSCNNQWWPEMDFSEAFVLWRGLGVDYEGGVLDHPARVAIHFTHRLGAIVVLILLGALIIQLLRRGKTLWPLTALLASMLLLQIMLGITNVVAGLPLAVATAHNGVAAILLCVLVSIIGHLSKAARPA